MKRKVKFLTVIILLLSFIFLLLIRLNYPLKVSTTESFFHMIPIYYWILLIIIPTLICITFILTESKSICTFLALVYFLTFFSFNLFFIIPAEQSDVGHAGFIFTTLKDSTTLSIQQYSYFQWPIHFTFFASIKEILDVGISIITIGLFSLILMIPLFFSLYKDNLSNNKVYFLLPVGYIILSYYFLNLQWVPQFTGLIFLILTICCYVKYKRNPSKKFYALTIFFYTICVFTHPFIFVFFPAAIFLDRYVVPQKPFISYNKNKGRNISLAFLVFIYGIGYVFIFTMGKHTRRLIFTENGRGSAWEIIGDLIGKREAVGVGAEYETHPFYHLVSERTYLISRYTALLLLMVIVLALAYTLLKNLKKVESFDISLGVASGGFFVFGLANPNLLGQRALQVTFLKFPRYFSNLFGSNRKILAIVLVLVVTFAPLIFTVNSAVNHSLSGGRLIQDQPTLQSGSFVDDYVGNDSNVLVADRFFYPSRKDNFNRVTPEWIAREEINRTEIDIVANSSKLTNRMEYYGEDAEYGTTSQIYDMGDAQVLVREDS